MPRRPAVPTALGLALCAGLIGLTGTAPAAEPAADAGPLPRSFRIEDLRVRLERSAGPVAGAAARSLEFSGRVVEQRGELLAMLDTLQALQFFSLPSRMTVQTSHVLREDGTVQTQWLQRSDEPATRICVAVSPGQERCVTFTASAAPADLVRFADQVFAGHVRR
ncbi:hypothetical protein [Sphaerotilus sp.]|uniref:hypothetical protein n=1 Tax=Sphaerotilus sp. TaxID=2093942 RepID=UPI0034E2F8CE